MTKQKTKMSLIKSNKQSIDKKETKQRLKATDEIKEKAFYYYAKGLTVKEVSKLLDLSFRTVQNWQTLDKWTEKLNPDSLKQKCYDLKNKGISYKQLATMFNISISSVQRYVNEVKNKIIKE